MATALNRVGARGAILQKEATPMSAHDHERMLDELGRIMRSMAERLEHSGERISGASLGATPADSTSKFIPFNLFCFEIAGAVYGIPLHDLNEVLRVRPNRIRPTWVACIAGVLDWRGGHAAVLDYTVPSLRIWRDDITLVVINSAVPIALRVDKLRSVVRVEAGQVRAARPGEPGTTHPACRQVFETEHHKVVLLDQHCLIAEDEIVDVFQALREHDARKRS